MCSSHSGPPMAADRQASHPGLMESWWKVKNPVLVWSESLIPQQGKIFIKVWEIEKITVGPITAPRNPRSGPAPAGPLLMSSSSFPGLPQEQHCLKDVSVTVGIFLALSPMEATSHISLGST